MRVKKINNIKFRNWCLPCTIHQVNSQLTRWSLWHYTYKIISYVRDHSFYNISLTIIFRLDFIAYSNTDNETNSTDETPQPQLDASMPRNATQNQTQADLESSLIHAYTHIHQWHNTHQCTYFLCVWICVYPANVSQDVIKAVVVSESESEPESESESESESRIEPECTSKRFNADVHIVVTRTNFCCDLKTGCLQFTIWTIIRNACWLVSLVYVVLFAWECFTTNAQSCTKLWKTLIGNS